MLSLSLDYALEEASFYVSRQPCGEAHIIELGNGSTEAAKSHMRELEGGSSPSQARDDPPAPDHSLMAASGGHPESEALSQASPGFLTHRN